MISRAPLLPLQRFPIVALDDPMRDNIRMCLQQDEARKVERGEHLRTQWNERELEATTGA